MFEAIIQFLENIFNNFYNIIHVNMNIADKGVAYVLAIFVFTLIIRLLILPLNIKAAKSTQGMQKIQPEIKKIQQKYKDDPKKMNVEVQKVYKENNVSVAGGCLPSLLPLPVLMALYYVFRRIEGLEGVSFLWINNLAASDQYYILPVLSAISTFLPSYLMTKSSPSPAEGGMDMRSMNYVMAGMMGFMSMRFNSILVLYWIIGNTIQLAQTYFLNYKPAMKQREERRVIEEDKNKNKEMFSLYETKNAASTKKKKKKK